MIEIGDPGLGGHLFRRMLSQTTIYGPTVS